MEKTNQENEPSSHQAGLELARTMLKEGASEEDILAKTSLSLPAIRGLKGSLVKASKRLNARSNQTEAISKPEIEIEPETKPTLDEDVEETHQIARTMAAIPLDYTSIANIRASIPEKQRPLFDAYMKLAEERMQSKNRVYDNDGHGVSAYPNQVNEAEAEYWRELSKTERMERANRAKNRFNKPESENASDPAKVFVDATKSVVEAIKLGVGVGSSANSGGGGFNAKDMLEFGEKREEKILAMQNNANNLAKTSVEANVFNVKMKEMEQIGAIEDKKLDFEVLKWKVAKDNEGKTIEQIKDLVKTVTEGPVGDVIRSVGQAGVDRIKGNQGGKIPTVNVLCPNCGNQWKANPDLSQVTCSICGAVLQKPSEPQSPPQTQELPSTQPSKTEVPQEARNETVVTNIEDLNKKSENVKEQPPRPQAQALPEPIKKVEIKEGEGQHAEQL